MKLTRSGLSLMIVLSLTGCGLFGGDDDDGDPVSGFINQQPPAPAGTTADVELLVGLSYPTQPLSFFLLPIVTASLSSNQEGCPQVIDSSDATTTHVEYIGDGCVVVNDAADPTDDSRIDGRFVVTGDNQGSTYEFQDFATWSISGCTGTDFDSSIALAGTVGLIPPSGSTANFAGTYDFLFSAEIDSLDDTTCEHGNVTVAFDQQLVAVSSGADTDADGQPDEFVTYDASGKTAFELVESPSPPPTTAGSWSSVATGLQHSTIDEISAGVDCEEPIAGTFSVTSDGDTAELTADGGTTCTSEACAPWTLNGAAQGDEICGIPGCHVVPPGNRPGRASLLFAAGLALTLALRRRRG